MDFQWFVNFSSIVNILILMYSIMLIISYVLMGILSIYAVLRYKARNSSSDYMTLLYGDSLSPSISIIASSYNESLTIIDCIRSLMGLRYHNYEVIVVNDGSNDDSFEKACEVFDMVKVEYFVNAQISTKKIRGVYKSRHKAYANLIFVDKENGGKADAMNVGLNIANKLYVVCVDADSIMPVDALLKLAKPITEGGNKEIVAVGGVVHVANACKIDRGVLLEKKVPNKYHIRMQIIEYLRSFLIGRMAWGQVNGLLLVSGALGIFRKDHLLAIGGYRTTSIGEDMELLLRLRRYLYDRKIAHRVEYIPEPLLWTEVPPTLKIMQRQRIRWTKGLIDALRIHKAVFFNPRYKVMGMVSYPFFFFFEWMAPFIEVLGFIYTLVLFALGFHQWKIFVVLSLFMYIFGVFYSFLGVFFGEITYHVYEKRSDLLKLLWVSLLEAFFYHPFLVYCSIKGNIQYLRKKNAWGVMTREGFEKK